MKQLVNIFVPAISEKYDILIPDDLKIQVLIPMIADSVEILSNHRYIKSGEERLCSREQGIQLRSGSTLKHYNIQNGDHLIIM